MEQVLKWGKRLGKKILELIIWLFLLSLMVFYMARLAPGDPLRAYYGDGVERMSTAQQLQAEEKLGLNRPIYVQYGLWLKGALSGDFGISFQYKQDCTAVIGSLWQNTALLGGLSYLLTFLLALLIGCFCAMREDSLWDKLLGKLSMVLSAIPSFWIALLLILLFSVNLGLLPSGGAYDPGGGGGWLDRLVHLILPLTVLVLGHVWYYAYLIRCRLLEEMRKDYVIFALSKGLSGKAVLYRHCLRGSLPYLISLMALSVPHILGGTYIVEKVFSYPGLGTLCFESAKYHDYNLLMVLTLLTAFFVIVCHMAAQAISQRLDPRMKGGKGFGFRTYE